MFQERKLEVALITSSVMEILQKTEIPNKVKFKCYIGVSRVYLQ